MTEYPEHEKMHAVKEQSQAIGAFLDDPNTGQLCEFNDEMGEFLPTHKTIERTLADYFDIDLDKIEAEKRDMLDKMRAANAR